MRSPLTANASMPSIISYGEYSRGDPRNGNPVSASNKVFSKLTCVLPDPFGARHEHCDHLMNGCDAALPNKFVLSVKTAAGFTPHEKLKHNLSRDPFAPLLLHHCNNVFLLEHFISENIPVECNISGHKSHHLYS